MNVGNDIFEVTYVREVAYTWCTKSTIGISKKVRNMKSIKFKKSFAIFGQLRTIIPKSPDISKN